MKLLAVDLAFSGSSGYAIFNENREVVLTGIFKPKPSRKSDLIQDKVQNTSLQIFEWAKGLIREVKPTHIYYEKPDWYMSGGKGVKAKVGLAHAETSFVLGCIVGSSRQLLPVSFGANQWKTKLCGNGKRDKIKTAQMIAQQYEGFEIDNKSVFLNGKKITFDEVDAIGLGLVVMSSLLG